MNFKFNLNKIISMKGLALVLVATTCTTSLTGCGKKADCNIDGKHAHLYTNEYGYVRYIDKEYMKYEGYTRSDENISIIGQEKLYKFFDKKDLLKIEDNINVIVSQQEKNVDYIEYRYSYTWMQPIPHTISNGKTTTTFFTYVPHKRYSWTSNPDRSGLTGETRNCHYVYTAYKIEKDEDGKYVLIPSSDVDDIRDVMDEYPYIKEKFYKVVSFDGEELDYEDGKEEDLSEEEKERIKEYESSNNEEKGKTLTKSK